MRLIRKFLQWLARGRFRKSSLNKEQVYLRALDMPAETHGTLVDDGAVDRGLPELKYDPEIDFSRVDDLESYTENLNVPTEDIEAWISAGLLYPDEIRTAERMIQILRKKGAPPKTHQR